MGTDNSVVKQNDQEFIELQEEKTGLIEKIKVLGTEQNKIEMTINSFEAQHTKELGDLLLKIFNVKKRIARKNAEDNPISIIAQNNLRQAEEEENEYKNSLSDGYDKTNIPSDDKNVQEVKKVARKLKLLVHPDRVNDQFKDTAEELFIRLMRAEKLHDWDTINQISEHFNNGLRIPLRNEAFSEKEIIITEIKYLRYRAAEIITVINTLRESEVYNTIADIKNWGAYFIATKATLEIELANLINQCV